MVYRVTVYGFDSGLNELLKAQQYNFRTRKYINPVKKHNDDICRKAIWYSELKKVKIDRPIVITYRFFVKDKRHDRSNIVSGFIKSFEDALQDCKVIKNDGWDDVLDYKHECCLDRKNPRVEVEIREVD